MLNFAYARYLLLLLLIPVFFVLQALVLRMRRNRVRKLGDEALVSRPLAMQSIHWFSNR